MSSYMSPGPQGAALAQPYPAAPQGGSRADRIGAMQSAPMPQVAATPGVVDVVSSVKAKTLQTTKRTTQFITSTWLEKPFQTSATWAALIAFLFACSSTFLTWSSVGGSFSGTIGAVSVDFKYVIDIAPTEARQESQGVADQFPQYDNKKSTTVVSLADIAPALSYMYSAGTTALALVIVGLFPSLLGTYLTIMRRVGTLHIIPGRYAKVLASPWFTPLMHGLSSVLFFIAWAAYAGTMNSNFNGPKVLAVFAAQARELFITIDADGNVTTEIPANLTFGAGFGLAIVASFMALGAAVLVALRPNEAARKAPDGFPPGASAASSSSNAAGAVPGAYGNDDAAPPAGATVVAPNPMNNLSSWIGASLGMPAAAPAAGLEAGASSDGLPPPPPAAAHFAPPLQQTQQSLQQPYTYGAGGAGGYTPEGFANVPVAASDDVPPALPPRTRPAPAAFSPQPTSGAIMTPQKEAGGRFINVATSPQPIGYSQDGVSAPPPAPGYASESGPTI